MKKGQKVKLTERGCLINAFSKIKVGDEMVFITENWTEIKNIIKLSRSEKVYKHYMLFKFKYNFILMGNNETIKGLELIYEPQFKQGDKVLYTDDLVNWKEGVFLVNHDESYIIKSYEMLLYAIEIKPYEEEIKVGDWVKRISDETIWKIRDKEDVNVALNSECTKIKNQQLIILLNNELK